MCVYVCVCVCVCVNTLSSSGCLPQTKSALAKWRVGEDQMRNDISCLCLHGNMLFTGHLPLAHTTFITSYTLHLTPSHSTSPTPHTLFTLHSVHLALTLVDDLTQWSPHTLFNKSHTHSAQSAVLYVYIYTITMLAGILSTHPIQ